MVTCSHIIIIVGVFLAFQFTSAKSVHVFLPLVAYSCHEDTYGTAALAWEGCIVRR